MNNRFGVVSAKRPQKLQDHRRQLELSLLKGSKKALRRRWKVAKEDEREGLSVLWENLKRDLRCAVRQRKYEKRRTMTNFFSDPYTYRISLHDPPKSGELSIEQDKLEEHLLRTYSDVLRHEGYTISPSLFVLAMQILLKAAGFNIPEAYIGKGMHKTLKAFMDDTTLIMNRKQVVQKT